MSQQQNQVAPLASQQHRLAATAVDGGLFYATCFIGGVVWALIQAATVVDGGLFYATCFIGFIGLIVWTLILWSKGQTPGKYLLKIRVLNEPTGTPATWGQMLIRQQLIGLALAAPYLIAYLLSIFYPNTSGWFGILVGYLMTLAIYFLFLAVYIVDVVWAFGPTRKRLVDYWAGTIVVNEANLLKPEL